MVHRSRLPTVFIANNGQNTDLNHQNVEFGDQFWTVFGQNGQNVIFFKKALGTFLSRLQALTNCKVSEKSNEGIPRKRVAHERTNGRTNEG